MHYFIFYFVSLHQISVISVTTSLYRYALDPVAKYLNSI